MTFDLDTAQLRAAGREARAVADRVDAARQASGAALPGNAFGLMCSPLLLPAYTVVQSVADALLAAAGSALERGAADLDLVAADFDAVDARQASGFDQVAGRS